MKNLNNADSDTGNISDAEEETTPAINDFQHSIQKTKLPDTSDRDYANLADIIKAEAYYK